MNNSNFKNDFNEENEDNLNMSSENIDEMNDKLSDIIDINELIDESCPLTGLFLSSMMLDKPFGMLWKQKIMIDFLKNLGYKIITRHSDVTNSDYYVAVEVGSKYIPESDNIRETFSKEIQNILVKLLLDLKKKLWRKK